MILEFDNAFDPKYDYLESVYQKILEAAFDLLNVKKNYEIDCSLVDEQTIQTINRDYRNIDRVTDVISFAFNDDESELGHIEDGDYPQMLGEIFICVPRALSQAKEIGNTDDRELSFLFAHGILHLLGYDHQTPEEEAIMFPLQEKILEAAKTKE